MVEDMGTGKLSGKLSLITHIWGFDACLSGRMRVFP